MKILFIANHLNIGGITSYLLNLASGLKKKGDEVYLASSGGDMLQEFTKKGIVFVPIPIKTKQEVGPKILRSFFKLSGFIKKNNIQIIHTNSRTTQVLGCLLSSSTGVCHISTCHGFFKKRFFRKLFPCWGQRVIAISQQVKEHLVNDFKVQEEKIIVVHNGIDLDKFRVRCQVSSIKLKESLGMGQGQVVGIVARLSDVKGHVYLIKAMKQVIEEIPGTQLLIVGEGDMKEKLVDLCRDLKIENDVFFMPSVSDTRQVLQAMDIFVMPSLKEGLGLALMEAMASGLAVIGSDVGGIRTLLDNGKNGILVKPQDAEALSAAIIKLLQDASQRELLGKNAGDFIYRNFPGEKMAEETRKGYEECLCAKS